MKEVINIFIEKCLDLSLSKYSRGQQPKPLERRFFFGHDASWKKGKITRKMLVYNLTLRLYPEVHTIVLFFMASLALRICFQLALVIYPFISLYFYLFFFFSKLSHYFRFIIYFNICNMSTCIETCKKWNIILEMSKLFLTFILTFFFSLSRAEELNSKEKLLI